MTVLRSRDFALSLEAAWQSYSNSLFAEDLDPAPARGYLWASSIRTCTRRMALDLLHPEVGRDFDNPGKERMLRGRERETALVARLMQVGQRCTPPFSVIESQTRIRICDRDGTLLCTGKVDGKLDFGGGRMQPKPIYEVKTGRAVSSVRTVEDLDRSEWTRHYVDQLLLYLYGASEPLGFILCETDAGPVFIWLALADYLQRVEELLVRMRSAVDARNGAPLPDFHPDQSLCRRCPHMGVHCAPPIGYKGVQVVDDPELEALLAEREALVEPARRFERVHKEVGQRLGRDYEQVLAGDYLITAKRGRKTTTEIPFDDIVLAAALHSDLGSPEEQALGRRLLDAASSGFRVTEEGGTLSHKIEWLGGETPGQQPAEE